MGADRDRQSIQSVRIFLASPSADTQAARRSVIAAIAALQEEPAHRHLRLELLRWDNDKRRIVCDRSHNPQHDIDQQIGNPGACDLVIGLFARTMGGTLPDDARFGRPSPERLWHCTEWEVEQGLRSQRLRQQGDLAGVTRGVWVLRDTSMPADVLTWPSDRQMAFFAGIQAVTQFVDRANPPGGPMREGKNFFASPAELDDLIRQGLREWLGQAFPVPLQAAQVSGHAARDTTWLHDPLTPDQQALLDALLAEPDDPPEPDAARLQLAEQVRQAPVRGLRGYLLRRYAEWCSTEGGRLDRRFVRLTLLVNHGREAEGEQFTPQGDKGRFDQLQALLAEHAGVQGWVLVGEPGSGKSTLLQHHELHTARAALRALAAAPDAAALRPEVCVWQRLSHCDAGEMLRSGQTPAAWLQEQWQLQWQQPQDVTLPALAEFQRHVRLRWVLDGLNEIRYASEAEFDAAVQAWRQWAATWCAQQALRQPAPLFSVRTREQADLGTSVRRIDIELWSAEQVRQYCRRRFGVAVGDPTMPDPPLWQALAALGHELELEMCRLPFNLAAQCTLYQRLGRLARHRAELISGLVWLGLVRDLDKPHLREPGLLTRHDRQRLLSVRDCGWRDADDLLLLPCEGRLLPWLDRQAEQMHRLGRTEGRAVSEPAGVVLQRLAAEPAPPQPPHWLEALQRLGWWDRSGTDRKTGQPLLRFTHQLWQEFFAARSLCDLLEERPAELPDLSPPALPELEQAVQGLGPQMPLLGPRVSHWEEAIKLLLQFGHQDHCTWLQALRPLNLPMAGRVAAGCRTELEPSPAGRTLLDALRQALLARSRDPAVDVRLRIEAGLALGELGDPRYEERQGPHGRYLWPKQWVKVAGGVYRIGDEDSSQPDEKPETDVTIEPFEMVFAPVTNAEYRCFMEAGGYQDEQWWEGETARQWLKEGVRNEAEIERMRALFAAASSDIEQFLGQYKLTDSQQEQWRDMATKSPTEHAQILDLWYGARRFDKPQEWLNPVFNAPTQPVVGICQFEAKAYAKWLEAQSGCKVRLPSEAEWEAAARGPARRRWPWGEVDPGRWQMNADPAHLRRTSPVGVFPEGDTPDGLTDLAGNVWEWTTSLYTDRLDEPGFNTEAPDGLARRVGRGGAWNFTIGYCRASYRGWYPPVNRDNSLGLRLVVSCPIPGTDP